MATSYTIPDHKKTKAKGRQISPIPFGKLNKDSPNIEPKSKNGSVSPSTSLCMDKPAWDMLIPKLNQLKTNQIEPNVRNNACTQETNLSTNFYANPNDFSQFLPDLRFIPHLSYSLSLPLSRPKITTPPSH